MLILTVILLSLLVAGCNSPPTPKPAEAEGKSAAAPAELGGTRDERGVIVAFGDSLTAGHGVEPGQSYPDFLQQELDRRGYPYRVINEGVSGDTSDQGLARAAMAAAYSADFVIVAFGGNDGLRALPVNRMKENLRSIILQLQQGGAQVILAGMKLPLNYGQEYRQAFENAYAELAEELDVVFLPFLLEGVGGRDELMQSDGMHPTVEGNRRVAQNVFRVLEPLLAAKIGEAAAR